MRHPSFESLPSFGPMRRIRANTIGNDGARAKPRNKRPWQAYRHARFVETCEI